MACLIKSNEIESRTLERESPDSIGIVVEQNRQVGSDQMLNDALLATYITEYKSLAENLG